ncbi:MAG: hypothetical protein COX29_04455 [Candidatus Moranbacteria bacterium CG23_combo_of_CG06-09_8_20_14_all_35_22]|nr:MAG: hypothetical protein COX29_04455 [Candidatus Moranbacteria bacterium CG23_combo_of_CG06-09_8_20_14_all_35_22]
MKKVLIGVSLFVFSAVSFLSPSIFFGVDITKTVSVLIVVAITLLIFFIGIYFVFKNKDAVKAQKILKIIKRISIVLAYYIIFLVVVLFQINSNETTGGF